MKLLIVQLSPFSPYLIPLRSKYSSQNLVLKHSVRDKVSHTHTKQLAEFEFVYFNLYIPRQQAGRRKTLNRMVASILCQYTALFKYLQVVKRNLKYLSYHLICIFRRTQITPRKCQCGICRRYQTLLP
jgi:hypothetical protein